MPNIKFIKDMLYELKKDYGERVDYCLLIKNEINLETGINTVTKKVYPITRAILLPTKLQRKFIQDIAYLAANKNFTYGALFDENTSVYIIDRRDLPKNVDIDLNNFFINKHKRFVIKSVDILEHDCGWVVTVQNHEGANPFAPIQLSIKNKLEYNQGVIND